MNSHFDQQSGHRILIIGLDGATFDLLDPWLAQGRLPHLQRLIEQGSANVLQSTFPPVTPVAWSSFITGRSPDRHGILGFQTYDPASRVVRLVNGQDIEGLSMWRIASAFGKRVCIINVPMAYPPEKVNGFLISGMDTPSMDSVFTHPKTLRDELLRRFPDYDFVVLLKNEGPLVVSQAGLKRYLSRVRRLIQVRAELAHYLFDRDDWDLFMVQFQSTDRIQHLFWPRLFNGEETETDQIVSIYTYLDQLVGQLAGEATKRKSSIFIVSDHGFGECYGTVAPNTLLERWGYLALRANPGARLLTWWNKALTSSPVGGWKYAIGKRIRFIRRQGLIEKLQLTMKRQCIPVDWARTQAIVRQGDLCGYLYLNSDRYRADGIVKGEAYEKLRAELRRRLLAETQDETGAPVFQQVLRGEQVFPSLYSKKSGPDLVLVPQDGFIVSCGLPDRVVTLHSAGTHRKDGVIIAAGSGIKQGVRLEAHITDVAPTILALMGLPVPTEMDGRVLAEMLDKVSYQIASVDGLSSEKPKESAAYTQVEEDAVEQRLKGLGYLA